MAPIEPSKFHWEHRLTRTSPDGRHVIMFRIGVGYWPCLHAPFLQIAFGKHIFEFWYGLPSYLKHPFRARRAMVGWNPLVNDQVPVSPNPFPSKQKLSGE